MSEQQSQMGIRRVDLALEPDELDVLSQRARHLKVSRSTVVKEAVLEYMIDRAPDLCREFVGNS